MKIIHLSQKLLKYMASEYKNTFAETFDFDILQAQFPDVPRELLNQSLIALRKDGLVDIFFADDIAYTTFLNVDGIREIEENTLLKKGYDLIKEIRSLL